MRWFSRSLSRKFSIATIAGFFLSALVFLGLFMAFYQSELERERAQAAVDVNRLLQSSLENAMLKRDLDGLVFIVNRLGQQPNINGVMIANPAGLIRFSSDPQAIGSVLGGEELAASSQHTYFALDSRGLEILRSVNPVNNKPQCKECHGSIAEHPVNGILVVDYDAASIRQKARDTTLMLMGAGALIVILNLLGGWWFIQRFILKPVASLSMASEALSQGQLETRVDLHGTDELAGLGDTFNLMASSLQSSVCELEEGKEFLQAVVDAIPDGLRIIDSEYNMLLVNQAFRDQTGCPDKLWVGEKCYLATHDRNSPCPAELMTCPLEEVQKQGMPLKVIHRHDRCSGESLDVEISAAPMLVVREGKEQTYIVESIRDLTKHVRFTHEQRLSELGRLAAGVAHEIYNPLSSMKLALHSLSSIMGESNRSEATKSLLNIVEQEMDQCIQITDRLLRMSAAPIGQSELVDIEKAVVDTLSLVKWDAEEGKIDIVECFPEYPLRVFASESEMRMLVLNLVQNAFHAMPSGGRLSIVGSVEDGDVLIRFEDNGIGIPAEILPKIFMPFFSRRADHVHGTGLGLPISRALAENFGGTLEVGSEVGKGSCFTIKLPEACSDGLT